MRAEGERVSLGSTISKKASQLAKQSRTSASFKAAEALAAGGEAVAAAAAGGGTTAAAAAAAAAAAPSLFAAITARLMKAMQSKSRALLCSACKAVGECAPPATQ